MLDCGGSLNVNNHIRSSEWKDKRPDGESLGPVGVVGVESCRASAEDCHRRLRWYDRRMKTLYLSYYGIFDTGRTQKFIADIGRLLAGNKPETIYFLLSSSGGEVEEAVSLHSYFRSLSIKKIFHNVGAVDSAANIVFLAGDTRYATPYATFLMHGVRISVLPSVRLNRIGLEETLATLINHENKFEEVMLSRTRYSKEDVQSFLQKELVVSSESALERGLIDQIMKVPVLPAFGASEDGDYYRNLE
jgi:ATP-dependent protease ClpP protease subunit